MRVGAFILNVLIVAALVMNVPASGSAWSGRIAQSHAIMSDMGPGEAPCPIGHCRDHEGGKANCPADFGACGGVVFLAVSSSVREFAHASTRIAFAHTKRPTVAPLRHDPPPPRAASADA